jgi:uncharacterized membrane protein
MKSILAIPFERLTLFAIIIIGSFYLFVLPPNSAPDEPSHFQSAYSVVDTILGQTADNPAEVSMRAADAGMEQKYNGLANMYTYQDFGKNLFLPLEDGGDEIVQIKRNQGAPHPYIYFPQTLGILLARAVQANPEWLYLLGRIFNLIFYAVCIWLAVKITPVGKGVFALVALYPMAMHLAASLNSDTYTTALVFLALAQYLRIAYADGPARFRDLLLVLLTMALAGPAKVIFIPIMMLAFFMPARCFETKKLAVIYRFIVAGVFVLTTFIALYVYIHRADGGVPVLTFENIEVNTIDNLLADPVLFAKMCKRTIEIKFGMLLHTMAGSELGWFEMNVNKMAINVFLALSVAAAFRAGDSDKSLALRDRIQFPVIFMITALGTAIIFFLSWTPVGSWDIIGLQGRYYIPVWPLFILFAARWPKPVRPPWLSDKALLFAACALHVFVLISVYLLIAGREYAVI